LTERVIVTGSRHWRDREKISKRLEKLPPETTIVVGYDPEKKKPKGVDEIVYEEGVRLGFTVEPHPARWEEFGKPAGFIRNKEMADVGGKLCIAFWDGLSTGTFDMMGQAVKRGIPVEVIH
jgi:hypothetical protein